jgi:hypothetical protein
MSRWKMMLAASLLAGSLIGLAFSSALGQISNVQVSNITGSSATITWTTSDTTDGCVHYGLTTALGDTACDVRPNDDIHFVQISGLSVDTTYYFEVASGGEVDSNGGSYYSFGTTKVEFGTPYIIYGLAYLSDSSKAAIVSANVKPPAGDLSYPLAALTDSMGVWFVNLGNLKDPATNDVFSYSVGDTIFITAEGGKEGQLFDTTTVSGASPQDCGPLGPVSRGDVNGDGAINVGDVVHLVNFLYRDGPPPIPASAGDFDCDGVTNVGDVVQLVNYLYRDGPPPAC